jgi:hypothetical protein
VTSRSSRSRGLLDSTNLADITVGTHLSALEYDTFIVINGNSGEFRRAMLCPCVRIDTRTPDVSCKQCHGIGRTYPMHLREPMIALDTNRNAMAKLAGAGKITQGSIQVTFPSKVVPGFGDMWLPDNEEHVVNETLFRGGSNRANAAVVRAGRVGDSVPRIPVARQERLLYPAPCCVENVSYKDADGETIHATPAQYHVDDDGRWTWKVGGPEMGKAWTVRYRAPAAYVVHLSSPVYRSEADEALPHKTTLQRLDTVSSEDLRQ